VIKRVSEQVSQRGIMGRVPGEGYRELAFNNSVQEKKKYRRTGKADSKKLGGPGKIGRPHSSSPMGAERSSKGKRWCLWRPWGPQKADNNVPDLKCVGGGGGGGGGGGDG